MFKNTFYQLFICSIFIFIGCNRIPNQQKLTPYLVVLGTLQDAGYPHINYPAEFKDTNKAYLVTSLALVDVSTNSKWLFEATPDMPRQLYDLESKHLKSDKIIDGVFLTHAHIGHYTGLMYFGREAMGARAIDVYAMPKMKTFLETNGPWSQLVKLENIKINSLEKEKPLYLNKKIQVVPFLVPHRDEYSETVGYKIIGPNKTALFIPDINKWTLWERDLVSELKKVDVAFLDATFLAEGEISRPMSEVPHPFIQETVSLLENQPKSIKAKVIFIHFNHSNPVIKVTNKKRKHLEKLGFQFAIRGAVFPI
ncbi:MBL fold metallo-hydrolase [Ascidiimonas sp. W6]|uniref:MBL fold metallo-hydrolase n=1 Tax=Ascidiimonas meishanensis TaxID=3128903 RepID=UPI0030EBADAA